MIQKYIQVIFSNYSKPKALEEEKQQYILMTYRSNIVPNDESTYYTSDSGWGCMVRVGQMFIANLLYKRQQLDKQAIVQLFFDNMTVPFSIQSITKYSAEAMPHMQKYEWFTPSQIGFAIKHLLQDFDSHYSVNICNDNSMFLSEISTQREKIVVLLMARIGLDEPQPEYLKCILRFMKSKYFFAILGGTPKKAHLFMKERQNYLGMLDPHKTQPAIKQYSDIPKHLKEYTSTLEWIPSHKIDSSMSIAFCFNREELQDFWQEMKNLKAELNEAFFIYMDEERPEYDEEAIIEIGSEFDDE